VKSPPGNPFSGCATYGITQSPQFLSLKEQTAEQAKLFWQTYLAGVAAVSEREESRKSDDEYNRLRRDLDEARQDVVQANRQRNLPPADMLALRNRAYKAWQALQIHLKKERIVP
jgi:hypothetical protein